LKVLKGEVAESKGQFPSACREPEQGSGRGGCGNASAEVEVVQQLLSELIASRGAGSSCPGEQDAVQRPGLPELIAELARSAAGHGRSAGGIDKTPSSFLWESSTDCAPGAGEAVVTSGGAAQGITGQRAGAAAGEQEVDIWAYKPSFRRINKEIRLTLDVLAVEAHRRRPSSAHRTYGTSHWGSRFSLITFPQRQSRSPYMLAMLAAAFWPVLFEALLLQR
jgi:hypothetical protein